MKTVINLILLSIVFMLFYFLWHYVHEDSLILKKEIVFNQNKHQVSERDVIARYVKKSLSKTSHTKANKKSNPALDINRTLKTNNIKENNTTHKNLSISIESILKQKSKQQNQSELVERNSTKDSKVKKSNQTDENYTIEGTLGGPQKSDKNTTLDLEKKREEMQQKKLWLKAKKEPLKVALKRVNAKIGDTVFLRIFKKSKELEVWIRPKTSNEFKLLKIYKICKYSGGLGPKQKEGDKKSPEGFYSVDYGALNPKSRFHLSFNLGYPNEYDRYYGYSGSYLMVHGKCKSIGCYAMGDRNIDDIYKLVKEALLNGQTRVFVHIFPFRMKQTILASYQKSKWYKFWKNLKEGYDAFEKSHQVPLIDIENGRYIIDKNSTSNPQVQPNY